MLAKLQVVVLAVLLSGLWPLSAVQAQATSKPHASAKHPGVKAKAKPPSPQTEQALPDPPPPPPPPTPEQMPSTPPEVTYRDKQLTIVARNSTLSDILNAVRQSTGAEFDVPQTANERVVGRFGPGSARDVLAKLLNGSQFNYVMVGTVAEPNSVAQMILTAKTGGVTPPQPGGEAPGFQQAVLPPTAPQFPAPQTEGAPEPADDDQADTEEQTSDTTGESAGDQTEGPQNPNQPAVKTPEQLLQELQRQQQLLQQQQQLQQQGQPIQPGQRPQLIYPNPPQEKPQE
jgi:hypothetical protein